MNQDLFNEKLELHKVWMADNSRGHRLDLYDVTLRGLTIISEDIKLAKFANCSFYDCIIDHNDFTEVDFKMVKFVNCSFYNNALIDSIITQAAFIESKVRRNTGLPLIFINLGKSDIQFNTESKELRIGSKVMPIHYWLNDKSFLKKYFTFTKEERKEYRKMITSLKKLYK